MRLSRQEPNANPTIELTLVPRKGTLTPNVQSHSSGAIFGIEHCWVIRVHQAVRYSTRTLSSVSYHPLPPAARKG